METYPVKTAATQLALATEPRFLPLLINFVEHSARAFGLGDREALALTLAAEELFAYLANGAARDRDLRVECRGGGYEVTTIFTLADNTLDMRVFNLTSRVTLDQEDLPAEMGLLIAARMADRLRFSQKAGTFQLTLTKEKLYPPLDDTVSPPPPAPVPAVAARTPDAAELNILLRLLHRYSPGLLPAEFTHPGKVVDMVAAGTYRAAIAVDQAGRIGGGLFWRGRGDRLVECYGPYLFAQPPATARLLLDYGLGALAKSHAVGLVNRYPAPALPTEYFEALGVLRHYLTDGSIQDIPVHYRHLDEDAGAVAWSHPALWEFLNREYQRLAFARDLVPVTEAGEMAAPHSVLATECNRPAGEVTLRPLWWGRDAATNLKEHVRVLLGDGLRNLFFELDLGRSWHGHFTPALLAAGFSPRVILPYAGQGDVAVFQHDGEVAP